jgi:hypothetical protein
VDITDEQVAAKFRAFEREHDPVLVHEALEIVEAAARDVAVEDRPACAVQLARWLRFLAALDGQMDPEWDSRDVPAKGAPLPAEHGVVYPSGEVDPATIPDPVARDEYERALKASKAKEERYRVQFQLRRIDERAMHAVGRLLERCHMHLPPDRQEFERQLAASTLSDATRERLRDLMPR